MKLSASLEYLEEHGIIEMSSSIAYEHRWQFTRYGVAHVEPLTHVRNKRLVCSPRPKIEMGNLTIIKLHHKLSMSGWSCRVKGLKQLKPVAYKGDGGEKIWWLKPSQKRFGKYYFACLLAAGQSMAFEVPHFKSEKFYKAMYEGKAPVDRQNKFNLFLAAILKQRLSKVVLVV